MNKNILATGIIVLFILSSISPMVFGNNINYNEKSTNIKDPLVDYYGVYSLEEIPEDIRPVISEEESQDIPVENYIVDSKESPITLDGPMDSPWPMYCHDTRHTGRSPYSTVNTYDEIWRYKQHEWDYVRGSPIVGENGTIYFGGISFYALYPNGTLKWKYKTLDEIFTSAAIDENGTIYFGAHTTSFSAKLYALVPIDDNAPDKPIIDGPNSGLIETEYTFSAASSDTDGDNISYFFDWGDGKNSGWTEYVPPGIVVNLSHCWEKSGTYTIKVKAKDDYSMESEWGELQVTMPRDKAVSNSLLQRLFDKFPLLEVILLKIINL